MTTSVQTCYRHDDRRAGVRCQRCDRPICPDCMHQASVGFHCPECVRSGGQKVLTARSLTARSLTAASTVVTRALVALNVAIYVLAAAPRGLMALTDEVVFDYATIGELVTRSGVVIGGVAEGEWYRLVTGGFLHGSLIHLAFNMYILWVLGQQLESAIGRAAFGAVYGASLLAGSLGVLLLDPRSLTVGASGAVFGMFGYALIGQLNRGINPMRTGLGGIVLLNLLITFAVPRISMGGHLGGLIGGLVAGLLYEGVRSRLRAPAWVAVSLVVALGLSCGLGAIVVGAGL